MSIDRALVPRTDSRPFARFLNATDIGLIFLVISVLALIIVPMPVFILDLLIGINISMSLLLLMLALYVPAALSLSTFPSLLLFTTLLRLALQIAATKQILLTGQAGHIIETFGRLVVGGNVLIGFVVFMVIAIVQFIVVAKGSERVAEVGARFTLDAMPGKQMSIDADLRAGNLTKEAARVRRQQLEKASQFHGAMDGAMKFVKNDAVAGLIIAFVNIVAGVGVGVLYRNMTVVESLNRFTLLTVGEGLVAQIPSLLVSIAAGVLVTREAGSESSSSNLGRDIGKQFLSQPVALMFTGFIVLAFLAIPGFPKIQFALLGLSALGLSLLLKRHLGKPGHAEQTPMPSLAREGRAEVPLFIDEDRGMPPSLALMLPPSTIEALDPVQLDLALQKVRRVVRHRLGVPFPGMSVLRSEGQPLSYALLVHDVPAGEGTLHPEHVRVSHAVPAESLQGLSSKDDPKDEAGLWLSAKHVPTLQARQVPFMEKEQVVAALVQEALLDHADTFLGIQETQQLINDAEEEYPELAQEVLRALPLQRIAETLRRLVQEGVSIRYLREILESLVTWGPREKDIVMLVEYVRVDLGKFTAYQYAKGSGRLKVIVLDSDVEQLIRDAIQPGNGGSYLAMAPEQVTAVTEVLKAGYDAVQATGQAPLIACSIDVRRYVRRMLEQINQKAAVVSFQEVGNHALIEPVYRVEMPYSARMESK